MKETKIAEDVLLLERGAHRAVLVREKDACVLINPSAAEKGFFEHLFSKYPARAVYISSRVFAPGAESVKRHFNIPFGAHELEKPFLKMRADFPLRDGEKLTCGIKVIHLQSQRAEGETVFFIEKFGVIAAGDVLKIYQDAFKMHDNHHYADHRKAQAGLRRLFSLNFEIFLPAVGELILKDAYHKLGGMFEELK